MKLKIGHYQGECKPGEFETNLATLCHGLKQGAEAGLDVMSFPETFLESYFITKEQIFAHAYPRHHPKIKKVLETTKQYPLMFMVGFFEEQDGKVYNTVILCEKGRIVGSYRKAFPCTQWETPGRSFDVFEKNGVKFGIVICADGGFIEPTRILALKGAQIIFAPHWNYIPQDSLVDHFLIVRHDHIARAVENGVYFLRGNNHVSGDDPTIGYPGVGYGDSYLLDPNGDVVVRAGLHRETLITAMIDTDHVAYAAGHNRSLASARGLGAMLCDAAAQAHDQGFRPTPRQRMAWKC